MGAFLKRFSTRLTEFPVKSEPISFHLQKNFMSTGEEKFKEAQLQTDAYDELQHAFIRKLTEVRENNKNWLAEYFQFWNQMTVDNLTNCFMLLADEENGMMDLRHFCWFLDGVGDDSTVQFREEKFKYIDTNRDGFITVDEFLVLVYNYQPTDETDEHLQDLAKTCFDISEHIQKVTLLSVGEQLQHGLF